MILPFLLHCGAMPTRNTVPWWAPGSAWSDRLTDELVATALLPLPDGFMGIAVVFPQSLVQFRSPGHWRVEPLIGDKVVKVYDTLGAAFGWPESLPQIGEIEFPFEPVDRTGSKTMTARSITNTRGVLEFDFARGDLKVTLPDVDADPFPWHKGGQLGGFTVRECNCPSEVNWH